MCPAGQMSLPFSFGLNWPELRTTITMQPHFLQNWNVISLRTTELPVDEVHAARIPGQNVLGAERRLRL